jgi:ABC-type Fe3+/spermidine/putrescine transport system ATPase subunit
VSNVPEPELRLKEKVSRACDKTVEDVINLWKVQEKADRNPKDNTHGSESHAAEAQRKTKHKVHRPRSG